MTQNMTRGIGCSLGWILLLVILIVYGCFAPVARTIEQAQSQGKPFCQIEVVCDVPGAVLLTKSGRAVGKCPVVFTVAMGIPNQSLPNSWIAPYPEMISVVNEGSLVRSDSVVYFLGRIIADGYYEKNLRVKLGRSYSVSGRKVVNVSLVQMPRSATASTLNVTQQQQQSVAADTIKHISTGESNQNTTETKTSIISSSNSRRWAVIIGVSKYQDSRIPSLRYASADANSFYDWIISPEGGKYSPSNVTLLTDKDATFDNIRSSLFSWLKQPIAEDIVTIYFAGHGSPSSPDDPENLFFLPYDTKYDDIETTGFPMWDIEIALKKFIKSERVVVIADACHSGGVGNSFDIARRSNRMIKVIPINSGVQDLSNVSDGICVISAADNDQFSQESQKWGGGHGVFTHFLIEGLKGEADYNKDSSVTLGEITSFLSENVRRATNSAQSPMVSGKYDPALSIGR